VARIVSTVLVVALLAATAAAFALTQGLKSQLSPIYGTNVDPVLSPVCGCDTRSATIFFKLREADRLDVEIVGGSKVVRALVRGREFPRGPVSLEWNGRDAAGDVLPEGDYEPRVRVRGAHQTITLPNAMRIDVTPPQLEHVRVSPTVFSPDGDGRADRVTFSYRLSEEARGMLFVDGKRLELKRFHRTEDAIGWNGKVRGKTLKAGTYEARLGAVDRAGNRARRTPPQPIVLRYVALGRKEIETTVGGRFAVRVASDATQVRWRLGDRTGVAQPGTLVLAAPLQPGRFTLTVTVHGHAVRAAVFVLEPAP
jgi:hypothetical protein